MEERDLSGVSLRTLERVLLLSKIFLAFLSDMISLTMDIIIKKTDEWEKTSYEELLLNFELLTALGDEPNLYSFVLAEHHRPANH